MPSIVCFVRGKESDLGDISQKIMDILGQADVVRYVETNSGARIFFDDILWVETPAVQKFREKIAYMALNPAVNRADYGPCLKIESYGYLFKFCAALSRKDLTTGITEYVMAPTVYTEAYINIPGLGEIQSTDESGPCTSMEQFSIILLSNAGDDHMKFLRSFAIPVKSFLRTPRLDGTFRMSYTGVIVFNSDVRAFFIRCPRGAIVVTIGSVSLVFTGMLTSALSNLEM